jgi:hypothetical protein
MRENGSKCPVGGIGASVETDCRNRSPDGSVSTADCMRERYTITRPEGREREERSGRESRGRREDARVKEPDALKRAVLQQ